MINVKNHKQAHLFDPWGHLGPKRRKRLDLSWAGLFREKILQNLPLEILAPFFKDDFGRPTKELSAVMGAVVLQQVFDLSDEQTVDQLAFNEQWHYALNIADETDAAKYFCPKTIYNVRSVFIANDLAAIVFDDITATLGAAFNVDFAKQRLDSVHFKSNMARLGRIRLIAKTITKFLVNLKRQNRELFGALSEELIARYVGPKSGSIFSMVKPSESERTLAQVATDLFDLSARFAGSAEVAGMNSFKLLLRVLHEQCDVPDVAAGAAGPFAPKPPGRVPSSSVQNPSDPDAGYSGHKGQGYHAQVMETYCDSDDPAVKAQTLDLVTLVEVESADQPDAEALGPALSAVVASGRSPEEVLADSAYGGDDNVAVAAELGVELVAPTPGAKKSDGLGLNDFVFSEDGSVVSCPAGQAPVKQKINEETGRHSASFDPRNCADCPHLPVCPTKAETKFRVLRFTAKELRLALRRAEEQTPEFRRRYAMRAGVEATMSALARLTGIKRLRFRGLAAVRFCVLLKATGLNIFRATSAQRARIKINSSILTRISTYFKSTCIAGAKTPIFSSRPRSIRRFNSYDHHFTRQVAA